MSQTNDFSYDRINDYAAVKISLAKPQDIRAWSYGEVKKPETINYRTYRPERDGLFCEKIFGPEKDWECACGKYRGMKYKGMTCDRCGVKITHSRVRRKRMGHIDLAAPVVHIWFFKAASSRLATLLAMKASNLEKVIYFQDFVVTNPFKKLRGRECGPWEGKYPIVSEVTAEDKFCVGHDENGNPVMVDCERFRLEDTPLTLCKLLTEEECRKLKEEYSGTEFSATENYDMGAEAIRKLLQNMDLVKLTKELRTELIDIKSKQRKKDIINRLKLVESLRDSDNRPEWIVLDVIPVIPPDLRPLVLLESGTFATSDLNDLYRRIINRNNRLKKLVDLNAPDVIIRNEKRMLQQSVDALFDNGRCKRPVLGSSNRPLKSLTDMIKGKQGRFRENLLGKRVDYSARSVIVVGPNLRLHQCGLPKKIALELYQPFIIRRLKELQHADTIKSAKKMLERKDEEVWDILEEVTQNHPVLLNRAPTLHRMGIQAFEPILVEGHAIKLHPLVCRGFNADFDGDQMAVHLPLSLEAQVEAHTLMLATNNIFSPANGAPIISPSQDVVMGCYYITMDSPLDKTRPPKEEKDLMQFASVDEVLYAYSQNIVKLHQKIVVRMPKGRKLKMSDSSEEKSNEVTEGKRFITTPGRIIFNNILPEGMPFYNEPLKSGGLAMVISDCHEYIGRRGTIDLLDSLMRLGFEESTKSGLSFATDDLITPKDKIDIIEKAEHEVARVQNQFMDGVITGDERYNQILDKWTHAREAITVKMMKELENDVRQDWYVNPIFLMANSGARGGVEQIRQLAGMRGLMAKPSGKIIETPIKANFREGLTVLEYFSSTHGARKGLADTALKTADSGYLTRKLADVAQNIVITQDNCGTSKGITKGVIYRGEKVEVSLADSIFGRVSRVNIVNPTTDEVIVRENELITREIGRKIEELGLEKIQIRSPMTCEAELGICARCYGMDLSTGRLVEEGMAVGIIAAQSIGEPGTQLTMRTFHIGGVAAHDVEESETKTKYAGTIKFVQVEEIDGVVLSRNGSIAILQKGREREKYNVPVGAELLVKDNQEVKAGQSLCKWDPHSIPILAKVAGKVTFSQIIEGETMRAEKDPLTGKIRRTVMDLKGDRHPQIELRDMKTNEMLDFYYLPGKAIIEVEDGAEVARGTLLAKTARDVSGTQDITGGLPRVTEIFESRKPKDPAIIAEIDGMVELGEKGRMGKRTILVRKERYWDDGSPMMDEKGEQMFIERVHDIPHGKHLKVHGGDYVIAGQAITDGPLVPHDILRINGEEAVQEYLVREIQNVYRSQRVKINDKHIEIIVSQMLRKVRIEEAGDTPLLEGIQVDKFMFIKTNREIEQCVLVIEPGDTGFEVDELVQKDEFERRCNEALANGRREAKGKRPELAQASPQLLGITKAAVQSSSFISAASFQETTKVLTEAALASKTDNLIGLKENVILGHLVPAGTGFRTYQNAQWRYHEEAADEFSKQDISSERHGFTLLEDVPGGSDSKNPFAVIDKDPFESSNVNPFEFLNNSEELGSGEDIDATLDQDFPIG